MNLDLYTNISNYLIESKDRGNLLSHQLLLKLNDQKYEEVKFNKENFIEILKSFSKEEFCIEENISDFKNIDKEEDLFSDFINSNPESHYLNNNYIDSLKIIKENENLFKRIYQVKDFNKKHYYGIWLFNGISWIYNSMDDLFLSKNNETIESKISNSYSLLLEKAFIQCFGTELIKFEINDYLKAMIGINPIVINSKNYTSINDFKDFLSFNSQNLIYFKNRNYFNIFKNFNPEDNLIEIKNNLNEIVKKDFNEFNNEFKELILFDTYPYYYNNFYAEDEICYYKLFVKEDSKINFEILKDLNLKIIISKIIDPNNFCLINYSNYIKKIFYEFTKGEYLLIIKNCEKNKIEQTFKYICTNPIDIEKIQIDIEHYDHLLVNFFENYIKNNNIDFETKLVNDDYKFSIEEKFIDELDIFLYKVISNDSSDKIIKFKTVNSKNICFYPEVSDNKKKSLKINYDFNKKFGIFLAERINKKKEFNIEFEFFGIEYVDKNDESLLESFDCDILKKIYEFKKKNYVNHYTIENPDVGCGCKIF